MIVIMGMFVLMSLVMVGCDLYSGGGRMMLFIWLVRVCVVLCLVVGLRLF